MHLLWRNSAFYTTEYSLWQQCLWFIFHAVSLSKVLIHHFSYVAICCEISKTFVTLGLVLSQYPRKMQNTKALAVCLKVSLQQWSAIISRCVGITQKTSWWHALWTCTKQLPVSGGHTSEWRYVSYSDIGGLWAHAEVATPSVTVPLLPLTHAWRL